MEKLKFKDFIWPNNPQRYREDYVREPMYTIDMEGTTVFNGLGEPRRIISGSGAFFGEEAYDTFRTLASIFKLNSHGTLVHPVWGSCECFFTKLQMNQEPRSDYVAYEFEFQEVDEDGNLPV